MVMTIASMCRFSIAALAAGVDPAHERVMERLWINYTKFVYQPNLSMQVTGRVYTIKKIAIT